MLRSSGPALDAEEIAIRALSFIAADSAILARFLDLTGWSPQTIADPNARYAILVAAVDYLMREEDLLLTFAASIGARPEDVSAAYRTLSDEKGGTGQAGSQ